MTERRCGTCQWFAIVRPESVVPWGYCTPLPPDMLRPFWYAAGYVHGDIHGADCSAWVEKETNDAQ